MNKKKILIVDDSAVILRALSLKLRASGYDVLTAEEGSGAVRQARESKPDLILLDLNFPGDPGGGVNWDGFGLMDWLKRVEEAKGIPIFVITSDTSAPCRDRALAAGALRFFPKPLKPEDLLLAIREVVGENPPPDGNRP